MVWPAIIAGGAALAGGALSFLGGQNANASAAAINSSQMDLQRELASLNVQLQHEAWTKQLQYRAADAIAAGIHPVFAMGAQPINVGTIAGGINPVAPTNAMEGFSQMGQDVGRAALAVMDHNERKAALAIQTRQLALQEMRQGAEIERTMAETELARSQAARLRGQVGPPFPAFGQVSPGGGNTAQVVTGRQGVFEWDPVKVATANPSDRGIAAGPAVPTVQWGWSSTGALQPFPAPGLKIEDEFMAPLMSRWLLTDVLAMNTGGVSGPVLKTVGMEIKAKYPQSIGFEWSHTKQGFVPIYKQTELSPWEFGVDVGRASGRRIGHQLHPRWRSQ